MASTRAIAMVVASLLAAVLTLGCKESVTPPALEVTVTTVSPPSGPLAGGTSVTITGTNLINVTSVTIGGNELGSRTVVSATQITGTTPAATSQGAKDVAVTSSSHGSGTCSGCFSYNPSPAVTVTAVSPATSPLAGGTNVTITGTNFVNVTSVTIGGNELGSRTVVSTTEITGTTAAAISPGAWDVVVTSSTHGSGTCTRCFTYVSAGGDQALAAGGLHTCALTSAGAAYCWGVNHWGQLGNGSTTTSATPVAVSGGLSFNALTAGGDGLYGHTCGLTNAGAAYCWGANFHGQLGDGSTTNKATPVAVAGGLRLSVLAAGFVHTCALTSSGAAYCWGTSSLTPVPVAGGLSFSILAAGWNHTCGLTSSGAAYCWGTSSLTPVPVAGGLSFSTLAAGGHHSCGVTSARAAYCWGSNDDGQLGDGSTTTSSVPVPVSGGLSFSALAAGGSPGSGHTCGLSSAGAVYCWGDNRGGQLGDGMILSGVPGPVSGGLSFSTLAVGGDHSCAATSAGAAYCWGYNLQGQLGNGTATTSPTPVDVTGGLSFSALAVGGSFHIGHTCGLTSVGAAYCWGWNDYGQLGNGSTTTSSVPVAVSGGLSFSTLAAGYRHTCGLTSAGAAYCWGWNDLGQLGDGSTTSSSTPVAVTGGLSFTALDAGGGHTCGLTSAGAPYCWGTNGYGQLGDGSTTNSSTPVAVTGGLSFSALAVGNNHTCGVTDAGAAYCWGYGMQGQLGNGSVTISSVPLAVAGGHSFGALTAGAYATCGLTGDGAAYCWGGAPIASTTVPVAVVGGLSFSALAAGYDHACGLTSARAAYCWGVNSYGQLGRGTFDYSTVPVAVAPF